MTPAQRDIDIVAGDVYVHVIEFVEDPTPYTYRAQLRQDPTVTGSAPEAVFAVDTGDLAVTGELVLTLTPAQTAALAPTKRYRWNLERVAGTDPTTIIAGAVDVVRKVSAT